MRIEKKNQEVRVLWTETIAMGLAFLVYYASGSRDPLMLCMLVLASTLSTAAIGLILLLARNAYFGKVSRDMFADYLRSAINRKNAGAPYGKALAAALEGVGFAPLKGNISAALKRRFLQAEDDAGGFAIGDRKWASAEIERYAHNAEASQATVEESAQRYATLNMFVSTVLPSFMIFAFIGSSILSQASFSLVAFSAILLLAVPVFYALGNLLMWRCLFA